MVALSVLKFIRLYQMKYLCNRLYSISSSSILSALPCIVNDNDLYKIKAPIILVYNVLLNNNSPSCQFQMTLKRGGLLFNNFFRKIQEWKKRVFCDFKDHFYLFDHQTILKNIARILYDFCIFGIWGKTHKFVKIGKTSGNTLEGVFSYSEIMPLQLTIHCIPYENVKHGLK